MERKPCTRVMGTELHNVTDVVGSLAQAGLDWTVSLEPAFAHVITPPEDWHPGWVDHLPIPDAYAVVREGDGGGEAHAIAAVGKKYVPIQNPNAFAVFDDIAKETGATFDAAGEWKGGRKVYLSMKLPEVIRFDGGNEDTEVFLTGITSHDGSSALNLMVSTIRLFCMNQTNAILSQARSRFTIRHTASAKVRLETALDTLRLVKTYVNDYQAEVDKMLDAVYTEVQFSKLVEQLLPTFPEMSDLQKNRNTEARRTLEHLWDAPTQDGIRGTKWGAFNSVAEYVDWFSPARGEDKELVRATRLMEGRDTMKVRARTLLAA